MSAPILRSRKSIVRPAREHAVAVHAQPITPDASLPQCPSVQGGFPLPPCLKPAQTRVKRRRPYCRRRAPRCSIAIRAAGVTARVNTVTKAKTIAVETLIHQCVDADAGRSRARYTDHRGAGLPGYAASG